MSNFIELHRNKRAAMAAAKKMMIHFPGVEIREVDHYFNRGHLCPYTLATQYVDKNARIRCLEVSWRVYHRDGWDIESYLFTNWKLLGWLA